MRIAFETRTCRSFPSAQSLYTVEVQTPRRPAASRTERSLGHMTSSEGIDCNPGVTRRLKSPPKPGQKSVLLAERFTVVPDSCVALLLSATPSSLPVTPEATGSSPVHPANFLARFRSVPERSPLNARVYGFARFLHRSLERPWSPSAALDFSPQLLKLQVGLRDRQRATLRRDRVPHFPHERW